jgi:hypothetical protein
MAEFIDLINKKFTKLTVISRAENASYGSARWNCVCDCGAKVVVNGSRLIGNGTKSCGCLQKSNARKRVLKHGMFGTKEYKTWESMIQRCTNPNSGSYKSYGGRGIKVCDEWINSFENFHKDMGDRPEGMSLDRIENDKDYSPENCRWATNSQQHRNTSRVVILTFNDKSQCLLDWAKEIKVSPGTVRNRLKQGWDLEKIINYYEIYKK